MGAGVTDRLVVWALGLVARCWRGLVLVGLVLLLGGAIR